MKKHVECLKKVNFISKLSNVMKCSKIGKDFYNASIEINIIYQKKQDSN